MDLALDNKNAGALRRPRPQGPAARPLVLALAVTLALTLLRYLQLGLSGLELGADEAQYWYWGQDLDWGYYSKPPMIGWLIALSTAMFGDTPFGVRFFTPLLLGGTGLALFAAGERLFGRAEGWAALWLWHAMPAVILAGTLISTDVPLLFFWSLALLSFIQWVGGGPRALRWAASTGAALGLAFLSKYAAAYFPLGMAVAALASPSVRRELTLRRLAVFGGVLLLILTPNLLWNAANGFQTVRHTADNADWKGFALHFGELGDFLLAQLFVLGPFLLPVLAIAVARPSFWKDERAAMLLGLTLPPLVIVSVQALLSRAHANWAVTAYPAALLLIPYILRGRMTRRLVYGATAVVHGAVAVLLFAVALDPDRADDLGLSNTFKRNRGWAETSEAVKAAALRTDGLILDDREVAAHLIWELRDWDFPLEVFDSNGRPDHTYDYVLGWEPDPGTRKLLVTHLPPTDLARHREMGILLPAGSFFVDLNARSAGRPARQLDFYIVEQ
jgi:4-amino-4-deoxy-L-arabinose transferase-like glycosyltransferase